MKTYPSLSIKPPPNSLESSGQGHIVMPITTIDPLILLIPSSSPTSSSSSSFTYSPISASSSEQEKSSPSSVLDEHFFPSTSSAIEIVFPDSLYHLSLEPFQLSYPHAPGNASPSGSNGGSSPLRAHKLKTYIAHISR